MKHSTLPLLWKLHAADLPIVDQIPGKSAWESEISDTKLGHCRTAGHTTRKHTRNDVKRRISIGECASGKWMAKQVQGRHMHRSSLLIARRRAGFQERLCSHAEVCSFRNSVRAGEVDGLIRATAQPLHGYRTTTASKSPKSPNSSTSTNLQMCSHP